MRQILTNWLTQLAVVLEKATGERPELRNAVLVTSSSLPSKLIWWAPAVPPGEPAVWIGADYSAVEVLTNSSGGTNLEQAYQEFAERSWRGVKGTAGGGRLNPPVPDAQLYRIEVKLPSTGEVQIFAACAAERRESRGVERPRQVAPRAGGTLGILLDTEIPYSVCIGSIRMPLQDLARLGAGSVVELNRALDEPSDIVVNGRVVARGRIVAVQGNYAVQVTEVCDGPSLQYRGRRSNTEPQPGAPQ